MWRTLTATPSETSGQSHYHPIVLLLPDLVVMCAAPSFPGSVPPAVRLSIESRPSLAFRLSPLAIRSSAIHLTLPRLSSPVSHPLSRLVTSPAFLTEAVVRGGHQHAGRVGVGLAGDVAAVPEHGTNEQRSDQRLAQLHYQTQQRRLQQTISCNQDRQIHY